MLCSVQLMITIIVPLALKLMVLIVWKILDKNVISCVYFEYLPNDVFSLSPSSFTANTVHFGHIEMITFEHPKTSWRQIRIWLIAHCNWSVLIKVKNNIGQKWFSHNHSVRMFISHLALAFLVIRRFSQNKTEKENFLKL